MREGTRVQAVARERLRGARRSPAGERDRAAGQAHLEHVAIEVLVPEGRHVGQDLHCLYERTNTTTALCCRILYCIMQHFRKYRYKITKRIVHSRLRVSISIPYAGDCMRAYP